MNILVISSFLPYPLYSGGHVRLYNLLKCLSKKHKMTLICEMRQNQTFSDVKELEKICSKVIAIKRKKQWSIQNILKAGLSKYPFLLIGHTSYEMKNAISKELNTKKYDLIHAETFYIMQNIPQNNLPIVLAEHNVEYRVYELYAKKAPFFLKPILFLDIAKIKRIEQAFWKKSSLLVAVSNEDKKVMESSGNKVNVISNGVDEKNFTLKIIGKDYFNSEKRILFIGDFKWIQNIDSAKWIIKYIWPKIISELNDQWKNNIKLWIVSRKIPNSLKNLSENKNIVFDEDSSSLDTPEIFKKAFALLAPIRVGGGTSYKILESMSVGTPVIITALSAGSLNITPDSEALVGNNEVELSSLVLKLINTPDLYMKLSKRGHEFITKNYSWENIAQKLDKLYENCANRY